VGGSQPPSRHRRRKYLGVGCSRAGLEVGHHRPAIVPVVSEMRTYSVSLVSEDSSHAVDVFYKYRGEHLPEEGEIIDVVRFLRGRVTRARVTRVDANTDPQIGATRRIGEGRGALAVTGCPGGEHERCDCGDRTRSRADPHQRRIHRRWRRQQPESSLSVGRPTVRLIGLTAPSSPLGSREIVGRASDSRIRPKGSHVHYLVLGGELRSDARWRAQAPHFWHVAECGKCDASGRSRNAPLVRSRW